MNASEVEDSYPLSPMQQGMLFHDMASTGSGSYVQQAFCDLRERIDAPLLQQAWRRVIERHPVLRTAFRIEGIRDPVQNVLRQVDLPWIDEDWRGLPPNDQETRFDAHLEVNRRRDFDPKAAPLMRLAMFRLADEQWRLLWTYHHALLDGRGVRVVLREVFDLYDAFSAGRELELPPPSPYREYIDWLSRQDEAAARRYWQQALAGGLGPSSVIGRRPERRGAVGPESYAAHEIRLTRQSTGALRSVARDHELSLNTLLLGAWAQLLSRYSGEARVSFGVTLALRGAGPDAFREMVGLLINSVPMRVDVPPEMPLLQWLEGLRAKWLAMRVHSWAPLTKIRQWGRVPHENPLFSSLVVYEHAPLDAVLKAERKDWTTRRFDRRSGASHPLTLVAFGEPELSLKLVYERSLFDSATIVPMLEHLRALLEGALACLEKPLKEQPLLTDAEKRRLLIEWNDTGRRFPSEACTHLLFEQQVERTPDAPAVESPGRVLAYRELNHRSNQLAHYLQRLGIATGTLVGICMDRTAEVVVAMLGIMKAGGAYLPLDASYPPERLEYIVSDAGLSTVITLEASAPRIGAFAKHIVLLDGHADRIARESTVNPACGVTLDDPAYAVYTSGSTGRPKGILIGHRALTNHTLALVERYAYSATDRRLQFVSISSDVLIADVFPVLTAGGTVVFRPGSAALSIADFLRFLEEQKITIASLPSAYWHEWVAAMSDEAAPFPSSLRLVISGMDSVRPDLFAVWKRKANKRVRWFNAYGPSETTCTAASYEADLASDETLSNVPIGRPLPNVRIYILDAQARPVPAGVPGEIYIAGHGVARGYLNRPDLTAAKFVRDPFSDNAEDRLYRTGDVGRYRPDGNIEFLGRVDDQIKIRGFRVEPGEVEAALRRLPQVCEAAVVARGERPDARQLIAYVVAAAGSQPACSELRALLRRALPEYMLPAAIVFLGAMPLTPNGKIDHAALPQPSLEAEQESRRHEPPRNPLERQLSALWEELLGTRVGIWDNFFDLGGDSLRGVQLLDKVLADFGVCIPIDALFDDDTATIAAMASRIEAERARPVSHGGPTIPRRLA
jgi:amino acid adenylation domain-containing protein